GQPTTNREAEARTAKVCRDQRRIAVNITCATVGLGTLRAGYAAPGWTPGGLEPTPKRQTGRSEPSTLKHLGDHIAQRSLCAFFHQHFEPATQLAAPRPAPAHGSRVPGALALRVPRNA